MSRGYRRMIGYDEVLGLDVKARKLRQDEFGRFTIDPDPPHPQRRLAPIGPDRGATGLPPRNHRHDVTVVVGYGGTWPSNEPIAIPGVAVCSTIAYAVGGP